MIDFDNPVIAFTALDRCDGCGAQAYSVAQKEGHADLLFCAHHRREHYATLLDEGWSVTDDYEGIESLTGTPMGAY